MGPRSPLSPLAPRRRAYDLLLRGLLWLSAGATCALLLALVGYLLWRGLPHLSLALLTGQESVLQGTEGILPALCNTLYVVVVTLALVLPLGVGAAVYLTEYARHPRLVRVMEFAADALSALPSILYALVGLLVFSQLLGLKKTLLAACLTLVFMNLPTVLRTTQESLRAVPRSDREGALALGAGRWRTIRTVVLPGAVDGIVTGCILSAGRVVGESAVLLYIAGMGTALNRFFTLDGFLHGAGSTLTVMLYVYARERSQFDLAFAVAALLLLLTLALNLAAGLVGRHLKRK